MQLQPVERRTPALHLQLLNNGDAPWSLATSISAGSYGREHLCKRLSICRLHDGIEDAKNVRLYRLPVSHDKRVKRANLGPFRTLSRNQEQVMAPKASKPLRGVFL